MALQITCFLLLTFVLGGYSQPQVLDPENPSRNILTALCMFNGYFSNIKTVQNEEKYHSYDHHDAVNVTYIPVEVPAFLPFPAVYFAENDNNVIIRQEILVFSELADGTIIIQPHNFTDPSKNKPNTIDISTLMELDIEDFEQPPEDCGLTFNLVEDNVIAGTWPDCKHRLENGQRPEYVLISTCNAFSSFNTYSETVETVSRSVYRHERYGSRYPYPPYLQERLANFKSPCDD